MSLKKDIREIVKYMLPDDATSDLIENYVDTFVLINKKHSKKLNLTDVGWQSEQLKTTNKPLPYKEWKEALKIHRPDESVLKINKSYTTLNEVLKMYEKYCDSF